MDERVLKWFYDALAAARAIRDFSRQKSFADYCDDDLLASAIERKFEIIGEALNRVRSHDPHALSTIGDWPAIIGFRNLLAHAYDHVEDSVVWGIVVNQLPGFIDELEGIPGLESDRGDVGSPVE